ISFRALWQLFEEKEPPPGFIDLGSMLTKPKDIVIEVAAIDRIEREKNPVKREKLTVTLLQGVLGNGYKAQMKPSRLTDRLLQLRKDMAANETAFDDKLKYFFWLN